MDTYISAMGVTALAAQWEEFLPLYLKEAALFAQKWLLDLTNSAIYHWTRYPAQIQPDSFRVLEILYDLQAQAYDMYWPGFNPYE